MRSNAPGTQNSSPRERARRRRQQAAALGVGQAYRALTDLRQTHLSDFER
jgi:hypothetical protein